jgi:hypothetical protein
MVSVNTRRVSGRMAAATCATSVASTSVTGQPSVSSVCIRLLELPNRKALETTWSPFFSSDHSTAAMAAMPLENDTVPVPSSIIVTLRSSACSVGLPWRP